MSLKRTRLGFESLESRKLLSGVTTAATVLVHIPDNLTGEPGGQVVAPVQIDNAAGVRGAEIRINYDTALLDASESSVRAGSLWPQGSSTQIVVRVDDAAGTIVASVFTAEGLSSGGGSLLDVQFTISASAPLESTTRVDLAQVRLNEGGIVPNPEPQPGPDSTDGLITFVSPSDTGSITGTVYADTNNNYRPDRHEGIPRVKIVLVGVDNGERRETYTDDSGRYQFNDLAPGAYRIIEQQPAAFLDGGANELAAQLADGQALNGQNFRERGLRSQYVFNRLFTTTALPVGSFNWVSAVRGLVTSADDVAAARQAISARSTAQQASKAVASPAVAARAIASQSTAKPVVRQTTTASQNVQNLVRLTPQAKRLKAIDRILASSALRLVK